MLLGAEDGVSEGLSWMSALVNSDLTALGGLTLESGLVEVIEYNFLELLVDFLLFPQNNIPLPLDRTSVQFRVLQDIRQDVDSSRDILVECLGVVDGLFSRSVGVQVSTHVFNFQLQSSLITGLGSLECEVLRVSLNFRRKRPYRLTSKK